MPVENYSYVSKLLVKSIKKFHYRKKKIDKEGFLQVHFVKLLILS